MPFHDRQNECNSTTLKNTTLTGDKTLLDPARINRTMKYVDRVSSLVPGCSLKCCTAIGPNAADIARMTETCVLQMQTCRRCHQLKQVLIKFAWCSCTGCYSGHRYNLTDKCVGAVCCSAYSEIGLWFHHTWATQTFRYYSHVNCTLQWPRVRARTLETDTAELWKVR